MADIKGRRNDCLDVELLFSIRLETTSLCLLDKESIFEAFKAAIGSLTASLCIVLPLCEVTWELAQIVEHLLSVR